MNKPENVIERNSMQLLENAIAFEATDIHLVPSEEGYTVLFKKDLKLHEISKIVHQLAIRMISFFSFFPH